MPLASWRARGSARAGRGTGRSGRAARVLGRGVVGFAVPTLLFYLLRAAGAGLYLALLASALVSAAPALVTLVRERRLDGLSAYWTAMTLGALAVSLAPGSTRFLLAKEAVLTGVTGAWFLASPWTSRRPLAYLFCQPLLEGRMRWPSDWETLWAASPPFRRMWRVSSTLWGIGLLTDAGLRVAAALTQPPDTVPAIGLALSVATLVVLNVVTSAWYVLCGVYDPRSRLRRAGSVPARAPVLGETAEEPGALAES